MAIKEFFEKTYQLLSDAFVWTWQVCSWIFNKCVGLVKKIAPQSVLISLASERLKDSPVSEIATSATIAKTFHQDSHEQEEFDYCGFMQSLLAINGKESIPHLVFRAFLASNWWARYRPKSQIYYILNRTYDFHYESTTIGVNIQLAQPDFLGRKELCQKILSDYTEIKANYELFLRGLIQNSAGTENLTPDAMAFPEFEDVCLYMKDQIESQKVSKKQNKR